MNTHSINFDGALLQRGFWIYVWVVTQRSKTVLYVGRTGDSSSRFAASPFSRIGRHLDLRRNAKGNSLTQRLRDEKMEPDRSRFDLVAVGPIFCEQKDLDSHRKFRDKVAALEAALADQLRRDGHRVIGTHPRLRPYDKRLFAQVYSRVAEQIKKYVGAG